MMEPTKKNKKLTLNTVGLILLVIIAVAYFYIWQARTEATAQTLVLSGNLTVARQQIKLIKTPADGLPAKLEAINAELAAAQSGFPNTLDRNEVIDYLLDVAGDYDIEILPLTSDGWVTVNIGQSYRVLKMKIVARGSLKDVESFITSLQSGRYPTLVITGCQVTREDVLSNDFPGDEMLVKVDLGIGIYTAAVPNGEGVLK